MPSAFDIGLPVVSCLSLLAVGCSSARPGTAVPDPDAAVAINLPDAGGVCRGPDGPPPGVASGTDPLCASSRSGISYAKDVVPVLSYCTGEICHAPWRYDTMVNQRSTSCCDHRWLIEPGQPSRSHVVQAVRGVDACVSRMPLDEGSLSDADIATLIAWVCEGAPNN